MRKGRRSVKKNQGLLPTPTTPPKSTPMSTLPPPGVPLFIPSSQVTTRVEKINDIDIVNLKNLLHKFKSQVSNNYAMRDLKQAIYFIGLQYDILDMVKEIQNMNKETHKTILKGSYGLKMVMEGNIVTSDIDIALYPLNEEVGKIQHNFERLREIVKSRFTDLYIRQKIQNVVNAVNDFEFTQFVFSMILTNRFIFDVSKSLTRENLWKFLLSEINPMSETFNYALGDISVFDSEYPATIEKAVNRNETIIPDVVNVNGFNIPTLEYYEREKTLLFCDLGCEDNAHVKKEEICLSGQIAAMKFNDIVSKDFLCSKFEKQLNVLKSSKSVGGKKKKKSLKRKTIKKHKNTQKRKQKKSLKRKRKV